MFHQKPYIKSTPPDVDIDDILKRYNSIQSQKEPPVKGPSQQAKNAKEQERKDDKPGPSTDTAPHSRPSKRKAHPAEDVSAKPSAPVEPPGKSDAKVKRRKVGDTDSVSKSDKKRPLSTIEEDSEADSTVQPEATAPKRRRRRKNAPRREMPDGFYDAPEPCAPCVESDQPCWIRRPNIGCYRCKDLLKRGRCPLSGTHRTRVADTEAALKQEQAAPQVDATPRAEDVTPAVNPLNESRKNQDIPKISGTDHDSRRLSPQPAKADIPAKPKGLPPSISQATIPSRDVTGQSTAVADRPPPASTPVGPTEGDVDAATSSGSKQQATRRVRPASPTELLTDSALHDLNVLGNRVFQVESSTVENQATLGALERFVEAHCDDATKLVNHERRIAQLESGLAEATKTLASYRQELDDANSRVRDQSTIISQYRTGLNLMLNALHAAVMPPRCAHGVDPSAPLTHVNPKHVDLGNPSVSAAIPRRHVDAISLSSGVDSHPASPRTGTHLDALIPMLSQVQANLIDLPPHLQSPNLNARAFRQNAAQLGISSDQLSGAFYTNGHNVCDRPEEWGIQGSKTRPQSSRQSDRSNTSNTTSHPDPLLAANRAVRDDDKPPSGPPDPSFRPQVVDKPASATGSLAQRSNTSNTSTPSHPDILHAPNRTVPDSGSPDPSFRHHVVDKPASTTGSLAEPSASLNPDVSFPNAAGSTAIHPGVPFSPPNDNPSSPRQSPSPTGGHTTSTANSPTPSRPASEDSKPLREDIFKNQDGPTPAAAVPSDDVSESQGRSTPIAEQPSDDVSKIEEGSSAAAEQPSHSERSTHNHQGGDRGPTGKNSEVRLDVDPGAIIGGGRVGPYTRGMSRRSVEPSADTASSQPYPCSKVRSTLKK
ncbi:hypothetical protein CC2G_006481 [Coprinopsis cinerea AmutBmut pab1-1]|nr:hypothetical protein CC2G_006481 [Coprinopsis cinerea AmutBmut pab1-1]